MKFSSLLFALLFSQISFSQEYEMVIEDVIFNSSSRVIIDEKTIRESNAQDLTTLITTQANINLFNNNFQPPQLFLRGGDSSHILFIIDGVPSFDASWAQRTMNLNTLDIQNVKRIEILKGGQTVLYGGQALAGVIKIDTFGAEFVDKKQASLTGGLPVDSFDRGFDDRRLTVTSEKAYEGGTSGSKASARIMDRKGQSPVLDSDRLYDQWQQNLDLGYESRGAVRTQVRSFYLKNKTRNPTTVNVMGQQSIADSDIQAQDEQAGASASMTFQEVAFQPRLGLYGQKGWRYFFSDPTSEDVDVKFRSGLQGANLDLNLFRNETVQVVSGLSYQREDFFIDDSTATLSASARKTKRFQETRGVYAQVKWAPVENFLLETGARLEKVSLIPEHNSYQIGLTFFKNTRLEWFTGYRAPSAAQKYGVFENAELEPETSQTYSITQDFKMESGEVSVTLFETSFDDYIEARSLGFGILQYQNTAKVKTRGVETTASYILDAANSIQASYAYQEPRDQVRHEFLRRRPRVSGSLRYFHNQEKWTAMLEGTGVGNRYDFFGANRYVFPGYFLVNTNFRYRLDEVNALALRVNNWLDFRPEISIDYYGEGRSALLTWEHTF